MFQDVSFGTLLLATCYNSSQSFLQRISGRGWWVGRVVPPLRGFAPTLIADAPSFCHESGNLGCLACRTYHQEGEKKCWAQTELPAPAGPATRPRLGQGGPKRVAFSY